MKKICIFTPMIFPIPAVKGGAVEGLVELIIRMNEQYKLADFTVVSIWDEEAEHISNKYKNTKFVFVKKKCCIDRIFLSKWIRYINIIGIKMWGKTIFSNPQVKRAWKKIRKGQFDRYVLEGGGDCYNFGYLNKKIDKNKLAIHFHGEVEGDLALAKWFGKYITVSNYIARKLICNGKIDSSKVSVLPNCFDADSMKTTISRTEIRSKYGFSDADVVYIFWGRLIPQKGALELIQAYKNLVKSCKNAKLLMVGSPNFGMPSSDGYNKYLEELCNDDELKEKVVFTGFINHDEMGNILNAADIGVIPSVWDDPAPLTVFEGMSKSLPLVVANVGGIPEIVKNEYNGLIVRWSEHYVDDLENAMLRLYEDTELRDILSKNAYMTAMQYNSERYYNSYIELM